MGCTVFSSASRQATYFGSGKRITFFWNTMNTRLRTVVLISFGLVCVWHLLLIFAGTSASADLANDDEKLTRAFSRQLQGIPNTFLQEARDADARNRLESIQAVAMVRVDDSAKNPAPTDAAERDDEGRSASECDMNEKMKLKSDHDYHEDDEDDRMDDRQLDYASRMGFSQYDEEEEDDEELLQNSIRFESGNHNKNDETGSILFSSGSFAGMHRVRLIYPGDVFDGIFENGTYRLGGSPSGKLSVSFEADAFDDNDEEYESDDEDGEDDYGDEDDTEEPDHSDGDGSAE